MSPPNKNADTPNSNSGRRDGDLPYSLRQALAHSSSSQSIRSTFPPLVDMQQRAEDRALLAGLSEEEIQEHKRQKIYNILQAALDVLNDGNEDNGSASASVRQSNQKLKGKQDRPEPRD